jgi:putative restriction endonuclease
MTSKRLWAREELIVTFNLYLKLPFGKMNKSTPEVKKLAEILGRTPSSIGMRLGNFASVDPFHINRGIVGLKNGIRQTQPIWDEFFNNQEELIFLVNKFLLKRRIFQLKRNLKIYFLI